MESSISNVKMVPALRLATHEIEDLMQASYLEAKRKRLLQVYLQEFIIIL